MSAVTVAIHQCAVCDVPNMVGANAQSIYVTAVCAVKVFGLEAMIATLCPEHREILEECIKVWKATGARISTTGGSA
jgi:hypothetical protein